MKMNSIENYINRTYPKFEKDDISSFIVNNNNKSSEFREYFMETFKQNPITMHSINEDGAEFLFNFSENSKVAEKIDYSGIIRDIEIKASAINFTIDGYNKLLEYLTDIHQISKKLPQNDIPINETCIKVLSQVAEKMLKIAQMRLSEL
jgi:hypothetical protein